MTTINESAEPEVLEMEVGNDYGSLLVWELRGTFYWYVSTYTRTNYETDGEKITEELYRQLVLQYYTENPTKTVPLRHCWASPHRHDEVEYEYELEGDDDDEVEYVYDKDEILREQEARAVLEKQRDELYRKDNPISEYATPALMLQGYYDGHVDRDAMLRTFDEASVYHVVCDVTGLITLEDPMVPKSLSQATHQSSQHKPIR